MLDRGDCEEIFYALAARESAIANGELGGCEHEPDEPHRNDCPVLWCLHLRFIMEKIGEDGSELAKIFEHRG